MRNVSVNNATQSINVIATTRVNIEIGVIMPHCHVTGIEPLIDSPCAFVCASL